MESPENTPRTPTGEVAGGNRIWFYVMFEGGLALLGLGLAWLAGFSAIGRPSLQADNIALVATIWGCGTGFVFFAAIWALDHLPGNPLASLHDLVERALAQLLREATFPQIVALSAAAGVGEEVLFRGFLQQGIADVLKRLEFGQLPAQCAAIGMAALIFGLLHAVSKTYLVAATLIGGLLGYLYLAVDDILAPIVAHAVYDFIAILYFVRSRNK